MMKSMWDERYSKSEYIYGEAPNVYFKAQLDQLWPGRLLLPCEGEGRNAVYAAAHGWHVDAFDQSEEGCKKAQQLAVRQGVRLHYQIADWLEVSYPLAYFDAIALVFAHLPAPIRQTGHRQLLPYLKPGGTLILEGFSPQQLAYNSGGPKDPAMLFTPALLREDFADLEIIELYEAIDVLNEGAYHQGPGATIRMVARK